MKKLYYLIFVFFLALIGGCHQQQLALTEVEKEAIKKEVKEQFTQMVSAVQQLNVDTWSENFSKDQFVSVMLGTDYINDRSQFLNVVKTYFSMRDHQQIDSVNVQIKVLSSNSVLLTSEENFKIWFKDGSNFQLNDAFSALWQKEQEGWKIIYAHESWSEK